MTRFLFSPFQKFLIWAAVILLLGFFFYALRSILIPFFLGLVIAHAFNPLVDRLERIYIPRAWGTFLVLALFYTALVGLFLWTFPLIQDLILKLVSKVPALSLEAHGQVQTFLERFSAYISPEQWAQLEEIVRTYMGDVLIGLGRLLGVLFSSGLAVASILGLVVVTPLVSFYFLKEWHLIVAKITSWLPCEYKETILTQATLMDRALAGYVRGQSLICIVLGIYFSVGLWAVGLQLGWAVGLYTGLAYLIPIIGPLSGFIIALIIGFFYQNDPQIFIFVIAIFGGGVVLETNFLTPRLLGKNIDVHPVWIVFAVFTGGYVFGLLGVILAVPVAAMLAVLARFLLAIYMKSTLYEAHTDAKR